MSKPRRTSFVELLDDSNTDDAVTSSRDDVVTLTPKRQPAPEPEPVSKALPVVREKPIEPVVAESAPPSRRRSPNDNTRHSYHASLYLPEEAQFALREIALTMRRAKPHDVMLEAMAELFEKYNKGDLAKQCRARIASRDKAVT